VNRDLVPVVDVIRSGVVESRHLGAAVVADPGGRILAHAGDPALASYLRSAAKPFQLLRMLESGLESGGAIPGSELALCAASHGGEEEHVAGVRRLLGRAGLDERQLRCGAHAPLDPEAARVLARAGRGPEAVHNNCSGKHAAMLITSASNGWPLESYLERGHPLQSAILAKVIDLAACVPGEGVDGCGVPTYFLPLVAAARMTASLMGLAEGDGPARRVVGVMTANPWYTSGSRRLAFKLMREVPGLLAKEGAEGFFIVGVPSDRSPFGGPVGLAIKVIDGAGEGARGREPAVASALLSLGIASSEERPQLAALATEPLRNVAGRVIGEVRGVLQL
jgi:L-asparaginase II